jgi:hypothetical protein
MIYSIAVVGGFSVSSFLPEQLFERVGIEGRFCAVPQGFDFVFNAGYEVASIGLISIQVNASDVV